MSNKKRKQKFYFNFRMAKMLFEYLRDGKIQPDKNIFDVKYKYVDAIKNAKDFTKPGNVIFKAEDMLEQLEKFYSSIDFSGHYNKDYLDGLIFMMDSFLKLSFDSDFLEQMELEAWFLSSASEKIISK